MEISKAVGPDNIPIEVWRGLSEEGICWFTKRFNVILRTHKMPEEWRLSTLIPLCKNKDDTLVCGNYRGIKLLSHTMKLWERVNREENQTRDGDKRKPIWFHARKINH